MNASLDGIPESIVIGVSMLGGGAVSLVAAGAILAMLADTIIPEAVEAAHSVAGLINVAGFLAAFVLTELGG